MSLLYPVELNSVSLLLVEMLLGLDAVLRMLLSCGYRRSLLLMTALLLQTVTAGNVAVICWSIDCEVVVWYSKYRLTAADTG